MGCHVNFKLYGVVYQILINKYLFCIGVSHYTTNMQLFSKEVTLLYLWYYTVNRYPIITMPNYSISNISKILTWQHLESIHNTIMKSTFFYERNVLKTTDIRQLNLSHRLLNHIELAVPVSRCNGLSVQYQSTGYAPTDIWQTPMLNLN